MDAVALPFRPPPAPRHRRRGAWFVWVNVGVCGLCLVHVVLAMLLLAVLGPQRLHDLVGERAYNAFFATMGVVQALFVIVPLLAFDALVGVVYGLWRMLRSHAWRVPGALLTAGVLAGTGWLARESIARPDPLKDQIFSLIVPMDTQYAPGYSNSAFRSVQVGMSEEQVLALLGAPLSDKRGGGLHSAFYSISPSDGNYWQRIVAYDEQGRVRSIHAGLWID